MSMAQWEFCKIERETVGAAEKEPAKGGSGTRGGSHGGAHGGAHGAGDKFTDRVYIFRMTAQRFTAGGLEKFAETEDYRGFVRDDPMHNQMGEKLLARLGEDGWEPFFTDTRSSQDYFSWHLKRQK